MIFALDASHDLLSERLYRKQKPNRTELDQLEVETISRDQNIKYYI